MGWGWVERWDARWGQHHSCVGAEGLQELKAGIYGRAGMAG